MDALTRAAVAGTSREAPPPGDLPTDGLLEGAAGMSPERLVLLRSGARAVYRTAGRAAESGVKPPSPAPEETLPACSAKAAEVVRQLLAGRRDAILHEALERLRVAGLRLPHALLPEALNVERKEPRSAVLAVLGKRGRWLAGFNPAWEWANASERRGTEEDDETAWQESTLPERLAALRRIRCRDAGRGRFLVEEVWKAEKAEARAAFVEALRDGLSLGDEAFLERALDDRSVKVRGAAAALLARLPGSAYAGRAEARADAVLDGYEPPGRDLLRRRRAGRLAVRLPEAADEAWRRDLPGEEKPPRGVGEKAWMIYRALSVTQPGHWEARFGAGPSELVSADCGGWEAAVLAGWCSAANLHGSRAWAVPLWERCYRMRGREQASEGRMLWDGALSLAGLLSGAELAGAFPRLLEKGEMTEGLARTLVLLPGPWDEALGERYLEALLAKNKKVFRGRDYPGSHWPGTLQTAAERLPTVCLQRANVEAPDQPEDGQEQYYEGYWRRELREFEETLELRRRLMKEIPL